MAELIGGSAGRPQTSAKSSPRACRSSIFASSRIETATSRDPKAPAHGQRRTLDREHDDHRGGESDGDSLRGKQLRERHEEGGEGEQSEQQATENPNRGRPPLDGVGEGGGHGAGGRGGGKSRGRAEGQKERDGARGERDADQPATDPGSPAAPGQACHAHQQRSQEKLESEHRGRAHLRSYRGLVTTPAPTNAFRTAAATRLAPALSPWMQMVS